MCLLSSIVMILFQVNLGLPVCFSSIVPADNLQKQVAHVFMGQMLIRHSTTMSKPSKELEAQTNNGKNHPAHYLLLS